MLAMCYVLVYYSQNITMTIYCAIILCLLFYLSFIFAHGLYSHFMLGITFFTSYVTVCKCHIALKAI